MGRDRNWLDQLRLLFAALVVFTHSFELIDHDGHREPLVRLLGTADFGKVAVCGFFILSGYLISSAWDRSPDPLAYLRNRALRIVPAFVVAFLLAVLAAGAMGAVDVEAYYRSLNWRRLGLDLVTLSQPSARFPGAQYYQVNGPMWTIQIEFLCYLIAPLVLFRRWLLYGLWGVCAVLVVATPAALQLSTLWLVAIPRFLLMFLSGAILWRMGVSANRWALIGCAVALPVLMLNLHTWALGIATAGAYLLLCAGLRGGAPRLPDVSYGVYLYGWPVQKLLIIWGVSEPWLLFPAALTIAMACGVASWFLIERHALRLKLGSRPRIRQSWDRLTYPGG